MYVDAMFVIYVLSFPLPMLVFISWDIMEKMPDFPKMEEIKPSSKFKSPRVRTIMTAAPVVNTLFSIAIFGCALAFLIWEILRDRKD